jgi:hypothetical protein
LRPKTIHCSFTPAGLKMSNLILFKKKLWAFRS